MTRILIVEDETALAEPLSYQLELEGYETAHADDGNAAVQLFLIRIWRRLSQQVQLPDPA